MVFNPLQILLDFFLRNDSRMKTGDYIFKTLVRIQYVDKRMCVVCILRISRSSHEMMNCESE